MVVGGSAEEEEGVCRMEGVWCRASTCDEEAGCDGYKPIKSTFEMERSIGGAGDGREKHMSAVVLGNGASMKKRTRW